MALGSTKFASTVLFTARPYLCEKVITKQRLWASERGFLHSLRRSIHSVVFRKDLHLRKS